MTNEHIPPRSTNNDRPVSRVIEPVDDSVLREVIEWPTGHVVPTLDRERNERPSRRGYVREYGKWFDLNDCAVVKLPLWDVCGAQPEAP